MSHGAEPPGDGVAAVDAFGGLPGLEDEELEAVVGAPPCVPPGLARGDSLGEVVQVAAPEGQDGGRGGAPRREGGEARGPDATGSGGQSGVPREACGRNHRQIGRAHV